MARYSRRRRTRRRRGKGRVRGALAWYWQLAWYWRLASGLGLVLVVAVVYLDYVVRSKFDGKKWALPARVYARPLELYEGLPLSPQDFEFELNGLDYRPADQLRRPGDMVKRGGQYQVFSRSFQFWDRLEPARKLSLEFAGARLVRLTDDAGQAVPLARLDPQLIGGIFPAHMEDRELIRLSEIPPLLGEALIAVEDQDFLEHRGISFKGVARAAWVNLRAGKIVQGGSTLTQQLVKNFYLSHDRNLSRKILEACMSLLLEFHYGKAEILETYINEVYLGQSGPRAIHGFALAARHYFGKPLDELALPQIALLVGLVKGASFYNPWSYPQRAKQRRDLVLTLMAEAALISVEEKEAAIGSSLGVVASDKRRLHDHPGFIDLVKRQLRRDYRADDLQAAGLQVFTTLAPSVQSRVARVLQRRIQQLERDYAMEAGTLQGATVLTSVGSGEVLAVVGGRHPHFAGFNRALDARRPVGSLIKPAIYLQALSQSQQYTLATRLSDTPVTVSGPDGELWQPRNFSQRDHGEVSLLEALSQSYNQSTARLGMQLGLGKVLETVSGLGVQRPLPQVPAVLLGAAELAPMEVAAMYHTIAADGVFTPLRSVRAVLDAQGQPLSRYPLQVEQRFAAETIHLLQYAMQAVMRTGTGRSVYRHIDEDLALAGKTGTTNNQRDSWFAGFSGDHLGVVWLGLDDNGQTPLTGATGAARVWGDIYAGLATRSLVFEKPIAVDYHWIDIDSGLLSGENCRGAQWIPFVRGSEPVLSGPCQFIENPVLRWFKRLW
ncbi:penicillin-binding protein 1B [Exilibacterium tricleocarpae]|uniref:Penicillin-binding protein 1B n=1 Tax=Exilibacterium tricleocarpae TaxID=2591008 RepID=A0A545T3B9_9GAMM|nr:penicillin-binding protein 1B [Exilibacterium tricleocarpae]TQV71717.1 penicillin-binding protein 1B [Exilibacterium tricleocarpae]